MVAGDDPALTTIAMRLHHSQKITNFAVTKPQNSDNEMNQFESFETINGTVVVVNKATITYIEPLTDGNSMIFFNSIGHNSQVQAIKVKCCIEEVEKILNGE